jgi:hypothetical protein
MPFPLHIFPAAFRNATHSRKEIEVPDRNFSTPDRETRNATRMRAIPTGKQENPDRILSIPDRETINPNWNATHLRGKLGIPTGTGLIPIGKGQIPTGMQPNPTGKGKFR